MPGVACGMADVTFRDFAGAIMSGEVDAAAARTAAQYFQAQSTSIGAAFMGKAMGLRAAMASGSEVEIGGLLRDCFGLADAPLSTAVATLRRTPS